MTMMELLRQGYSFKHCKKMLNWSWMNHEHLSRGLQRLILKIKTMNDISDLEKIIGPTADRHFRMNQEYTRTDVENFIKLYVRGIGNPMALSYNQWNSGMRRILPLFDGLGGGRYVFKGSRLSAAGQCYTGKVFHKKKGTGMMHVGNWTKGRFEWLPGQQMTNLDTLG